MDNAKFTGTYVGGSGFYGGLIEGDMVVSTYTLPVEETSLEVKSLYFDEDKGVTVVIWNDDTKTVVRTCNDDLFDRERGFLQAYFEKVQGGTKTQANKYLKKLVKEASTKKIKLAKKSEKEAKKTIEVSENTEPEVISVKTLAERLIK